MKIEVSQEFFDEAMKNFEEKAKGGKAWPDDPAPRYEIHRTDRTALRLYDEGIDIRRKMRVA